MAAIYATPSSPWNGLVRSCTSIRYCRAAIAGLGAQTLDPAFARYYLPRLDLFLAPARAALDWDFGKMREAGEKLRAVNRPGRGLSPEFLQYIAVEYQTLVAEGERYPIKALAARYQPIHPSAVSRWISAARARGYLPSKGETDAR